MSTFFDVSFDPGKFVALIPTLMSVVGSMNIVRLIQRSPSFKEGSFTKHILMSMSLCEMISCVAFSMQSLFIPRETSHILWAIGNGSVLGLMMQFSISSYIFSCFVSFIYLSKIRFEDASNNGSRTNPINRDFVMKRIEPWTGTLGFGYPIITALIGTAMLYYNRIIDTILPSISTTTDEAILSRQREFSNRISRFLFPGYPITNLIAAIAVNSLVIYCFVRPKKQHASTPSPKTQQQQQSITASPTSPSISQTNGVATAAVLLTYLWTAILRVFESNDILHHFSTRGLYPLIVLQLFLLPALGLYNVMTWLQSRKITRIQALYPFESKLWCIRRALFGRKKVFPSKVSFSPSNSISKIIDDNEYTLSPRRSCRF
jgi:hypothetical protein